MSALATPSLAEEYRTVTDGAALFDRSDTGRLRLTGEDALDLLERLSTNALADLGVGEGIPTVLTSNKGRIIDLLLVMRQPDSLLVFAGPNTRNRVAEWIDFYTIVEDVETEDITGDTAMLSVAGAEAGPVLDGVARPGVSGMPLYRSAPATFGDIDATVVRSDFTGSSAYNIVVPAAAAGPLRERLMEGGATPVGAEAVEAVRVERGVPVSGKELGEAYNPLEAGLKGFISFTKGCYVGQEVVARLDTYDKVQKHLVGITWGSDALPGPDAKLVLDGRQVGVVTSAVGAPRLDSNIGLGYVRKAHAGPGTLLTLELEDGEVQASVADLPFVPAP